MVGERRSNGLNNQKCDIKDGDYSLADYCDIGVNLTNKRFSDDLDEVIARSLSANVNALLLTGTSEAESKQALTLALAYPHCCWSTAGIHPHDAAQASPNFQQNLSTLAGHHKVVAIGECGLDFNRNFSPKTAQLNVFEGQLEVAKQLAMPVFLHERDAFDEQFALLQRYAGLTGVAHCFTGTVQQMHHYLDLGLYIGITGWLCDPKRGTALREAVKTLPLERMLVETDAPYLTPKNLPGKIRRNEPCYLPHIVSEIAQIKQLSPHEVQAATWQNSVALFGLKN